MLNEIKLQTCEKELKTNLSIEGSHWTQEADFFFFLEKNVFEEGGQVPVPSSRRPCQPQPHGSGFRIKGTRKGLYPCIPQQRKATEARCVAGEPLQRGLKRPLCEAGKVKPALPWKPQEVGGARIVGYLPRKTAGQVRGRTNRETVLWAIRLKGHGKLKSALTSDVEMQNLEFACWFSVLLYSCFLTIPPLPPFWNDNILRAVVCWKCVILIL